MALINKLKSIADAIREKTGKTDGLTLDAMPEEIRNIKTAKEPYVEETYDENGDLIDAKLVGYTSIRNYAFYNCANLTELTFEGTPALIHQTAFSGCTNLTVINVPWSEGDVANAPWGAVNATINYDYTGD